MTDKGSVKVMDFGLAKVLGGSLITKEAKTMGTVAYMSPEQAQGEVVDQRTDIWSLGVVLYEMLTGQLPFKGEFEQSMIHSILNHEPEPLTPGCAPACQKRHKNVVLTALAKKPAGRYQAMEELREDLRSRRRRSEAAQGQADQGEGGYKEYEGSMSTAGLGSLAILFGINVVQACGTGFSDEVPLRPRAFKLAVLPFETPDGRPRTRILKRHGMTQEMISQLGSLHRGEWSVIARASVMLYKKAGTPIGQIGRELRVAYVLEGTARREGDRIPHLRRTYQSTRPNAGLRPRPMTAKCPASWPCRAISPGGCRGPGHQAAAERGGAAGRESQGR